MSEDVTSIIPVFKINTVDVDKLMQKMKEKLMEKATGVESLDRTSIELVLSMQSLFKDLVSGTSSKVIISPMIAEQALLDDALILSLSVRDNIIRPKLTEFKHYMSQGDKKKAVESLSEVMKLQQIAYEAMILVLNERLTHIYVNMPPKLRPSLANASMGYDMLEPTS